MLLEHLGESSQSSSSFQLSVTDTGSSSGSSSFPYCSLLHAGQAFSGTLTTVATLLRPDNGISLGVNVRIQGYDLESGYLCGTMETLNAPMENISTQVTFWEGEIIDNKNSTFTSGSGKCKWEAGYGCKEQYPVSVGSDCGLELNKDAFYYVSFNCHNGFIRGFYYDKGCSEIRKISRRHLKLETTNNGRLGFSFASYELQ